jgi:hypothetical protein
MSTTMANYAFGQVDPLTGISFLQSGIIYSDENEFHISNDINIREFFNGNIIRVSGQTIEGFPYITYSKISDSDIDTHGIIFINNQFVKLSFIEKLIVIEEEKTDDLAILIKYTQRLFSENFANISMYIFDKEQNKLNDYYQKNGRIPNTNIEIRVVDGEHQEFYFSNGTTNEFGFFETKFWIPDNYPQDVFTITIDAENENSKSRKTVQMFGLGKPSSNSTG